MGGRLPGREQRWAYGWALSNRWALGINWGPDVTLGMAHSICCPGLVIGFIKLLMRHAGELGLCFLDRIPQNMIFLTMVHALSLARFITGQTPKEESQ